MIDQQTAARDLHAIRSLMERATIYRTISGPTALFGAVLALGTAGVLAFLSLAGAPLGGFDFVLAWLVVLVISATFNFALIHRDSVRRREPFVSPRMLLALRTIAPPMLVGGVLGISLSLRFAEPAFAAITWIFCYGLALVATSGFAPKSVVLLGAAFILSGFALLLFWHLLDALGAAPPVLLGALFMGATFGLLHLVYGICVVFVRTQSESDERLPA